MGVLICKIVPMRKRLKMCRMLDVAILVLSVVRYSEASAVGLNAASPLPKECKQQSGIIQVAPRGGAIDPGMFRRRVEEDRMPSLFDDNEMPYDRYAACLAATEGLRRIRDRDLAREVEMHKRGTADRDLGEAEKYITAKYVQNSAKVLRALGMTVTEFNDLGRSISKDESLKQRVIEQAYLYRMAATIHMDKANLLEDPSSAEILRAVPRDKVQMFSESLFEIEQLRADQIERLKKSLHVDKFPEHVNISDPSLLPFLSPKVRAVVQAFPLQAEEIVKKHGLQSDEFNQMLQETKANPIFRWKIQKQMKAGHPEKAPGSGETVPDRAPQGEGPSTTTSVASSATSSPSSSPLGI